MNSKPSRSSSKAKPWNQAQWESWSELMAKVQQGDVQAYEQLLNELGPVLLGYVRKRVFNPEIVQDVYQEVLLTFHKARHGPYEVDRPFGPWLLRWPAIPCWTRAGQKPPLRGKRNRRGRSCHGNKPGGSDGSLADDLDQALKALPPLNRQAIELLKLRGLTLEEAAKELKISVPALKVRAHRGYSRLREILKGKK